MTALRMVAGTLLAFGISGGASGFERPIEVQVASVPTTTGPGVAVAPDGEHVYTTSWADDAVNVLDRDPGDGTLTLVETLTDGVGGVDGLDGAWSVAVSPDGAYVYVGSYFEASVAVFSRDVGTGELTFVEVERDGVGGVDGLETVVALALDPSGDDLYAAGRDGDAIAIFARNASTGELTFLEVERQGVAGVQNLVKPADIAVAPDGAHLYASSLGPVGGKGGRRCGGRRGHECRRRARVCRVGDDPRLRRVRPGRPHGCAHPGPTADRANRGHAAAQRRSQRHRGGSGRSVRVLHDGEQDHPPRPGRTLRHVVASVHVGDAGRGGDRREPGRRQCLSAARGGAADRGVARDHVQSDAGRSVQHLADAGSRQPRPDGRRFPQMEVAARSGDHARRRGRRLGRGNRLRTLSL